MRLAVFYDRSPGTVGEYFFRAFITLGHEVVHFNTSRANECDGIYDLYLRLDHGDYTYDLPYRFRPRAFYVVDTHLEKSWRSIRRQASSYDVVFCVQREATRYLSRSHWVPLACDPEVHCRTTGSVCYDVAFVGNDGGVPRKFYLQELRERYPNSFIGKAPYTEMAKIYSQAKLVFHYIECTSPIKDMVSMRVYEALSTGRMLVANALVEGSYEALGFRPGQELVFYRTPQELFDVVDWYLSHEDERNSIAMAGQRCVLEKHTYRHRAEQIIKMCRQQLNIST